MADEVFVKYKSDIDELLADNKKVVTSIVKVKKAEDETNKAFENAAKTREKSLKTTQAELKKLEAANKKAFKTDGVNKFNKEIDQSKGKIKALGGELGKVDKQGKAFTGTLRTIALSLAAAFSIQRLGAFLGELIEIGKQVEGVRISFGRINDPNLLRNLRNSTQGTVNDLELMRNAVRARNFEVPLEKLAKLFKFAQQRARETGESVQFLVDSIILGIGRKSPLILDNLGISAVKLRETLRGAAVEMATVADVAEAVTKIIDENLTPAIDLNADRLDRNLVILQNFRIELSEKALPAAAEFTDALASQAKILNAENIPAAEKASAVFGIRGFLGVLNTGLALLNEYNIAAINLASEFLNLGVVVDFVKDLFGLQGQDAILARIRVDELRVSIEQEINTGNVEAAKEKFQELTGATDETVTSFNDFLEKINEINARFADLPTEAVSPFAFDATTINQIEKAIAGLEKGFGDLIPGTDLFILRQATINGLREKLNEITGKTTESDKALAKAEKDAAKEAARLNKEFEKRIALLKKDFAQAQKDAQKDINDFIKATQDQSKALEDASNTEVDLALNNAILRAKLNEDRISEEKARFEKSKELLNRSFLEDHNITKNEQEALDLLAEEHQGNLTRITEEGEEDRRIIREQESLFALESAAQFTAGIRNLQNTVTRNEIQQAELRFQNGLISEEQLATQIKSIRLKGAQDAKALALVEAGLQIPINIIKAQGTGPIIPNIPAGVLAGILAGIQFAAVAAVNPAFKEGTQSAPGGLATIAEAGPELAIMPDGTARLYKEPQTTYIEKGTKIETASKTKRILGMSDVSINSKGQLTGSLSIKAQLNDKRIVKGLDRLNAKKGIDSRAIGKEIAKANYLTTKYQ